MNIVTREEAAATDMPTTIAQYRDGAVQYATHATREAAAAHAYSESLTDPFAWISALGAESVMFGGFGPRRRATFATWHDGRSDWR